MLATSWASLHLIAAGHPVVLVPDADSSSSDGEVRAIG
jgi:hypothetical protein